MNYFITLAKVLMGLIWLLLIANIFFPFPGKIAILFYLLFSFIIFMHLLQLSIVYVAFSDKLKLTKLEAFQVFIFGIFKLWQLKVRIN